MSSQGSGAEFSRPGATTQLGVLTRMSMAYADDTSSGSQNYAFEVVQQCDCQFASPSLLDTASCFPANWGEEAQDLYWIESATLRERMFQISVMMLYSCDRCLAFSQQTYSGDQEARLHYGPVSSIQILSENSLTPPFIYGSRAHRGASKATEISTSSLPQSLPHGLDIQVSCTAMRGRFVH